MMAFFLVDDVMKMLGVSKSKAYKIMQSLNKELNKKGYITVAGKVPKKFFCEKFYCDMDDIAAQDKAIAVGK